MISATSQQGSSAFGDVTRNRRGDITDPRQPMQTSLPKRKAGTQPKNADSSGGQAPSHASQGPHRSATVSALSGLGFTKTISPVQRIQTPNTSMPSLLPPHSIQTLYTTHQPSASQAMQSTVIAEESAIVDASAVAGKPHCTFGPAPISWDTAEMFHPDPSALLHSMGYSYPAAGVGRISPNLSGLPHEPAEGSVQRTWEYPQQQLAIHSPDMPIYAAGAVANAQQQQAWYGYSASQPNQ